ncbi:hypothetical protein [Caballeronia sp. dw_19]|jgi:hypothetical protein|uniref:hypothetical protein n=1 Tax=Caballeronia sp. dw_19 TaxID=2719791 RepID=UPI001BD4BB67|nr:hypothetical protein [Caballeronia sp. dw_19]
MKAKLSAEQKDAENVLHLNDYRDIESQPLAAALQAKQDRIQSIHDHINHHLNDPDAPVVAAAMVYLDAHGRIGVAAAGIDPELAPRIAQELRDVARIVDLHQFVRRKKPNTQGSASLLLLSAIGFIAATYVNEIAWLDSVLNCAAQITALVLARRARN